MNSRNSSIKEDWNKLYRAISENGRNELKSKYDPFLLEDLEMYTGKYIELLRASDNKYFDGKLEYCKIDIDPIYKKDISKVLYKFKLENYPDEISFEAETIQPNYGHPRKYYFNINDKPIWRIVFKQG